ncbi:uncharacterized protein N7511_011547 [Penicillium nucicola]|uniref:uncharacterized protein n=1 Tax=Penicillium nucicola TaxID=1850975 RepID=UPI0025452C7A|nr:uncharacterized protein N7511_011547 [Penicillium nucicola]KAJ5742361.1 hypothetical protein N7511_011547 [Penicillium nucicola]
MGDLLFSEDKVAFTIELTESSYVKEIIGGSIEPEGGFFPRWLRSNSIRGEDEATLAEGKLLLNVSATAMVKDGDNNEDREISLSWNGIVAIDEHVRSILEGTFPEEKETEFGNPTANFKFQDEDLKDRVFVGTGQFVTTSGQLSIRYKVSEQIDLSIPSRLD